MFVGRIEDLGCAVHVVSRQEPCTYLGLLSVIHGAAGSVVSRDFLFSFLHDTRDDHSSNPDNTMAYQHAMLNVHQVLYLCRVKYS